MSPPHPASVQSSAPAGSGPPANSAAASSDAANPGGFAHTPALDGIRGAAILLVLFDHLFWSNSHTGNRIFDLLNAVRDSSYIGVNLFFALSGFLITGILLDTRQREHYFRIFYGRRTLRIFPLYYGVLLLLLLFTRPLHLVWNGWQWWYLTYTANLDLWASPRMVLPHFNINHFWSLQVEEQFYLVWPFIVYRIRRLRTLIQVSFLFACCALLLRVVFVSQRPHLSNTFLPYSFTLSCFDNLLFGCILCALLRTSMRDRVLQLAPRVFAVCASILLVVAFLDHGLDWTSSFFIPTLGFSIIGVAAAALIAMTLIPGSRAQSIFRNSTLRFFGKYSYGLYVFHYSLDETFTPLLRTAIDERFHSKALGVAGAALVVGVLSLLVALASYHLYEVHFLKLKRYFSYNSGRKAIA